MGSWVARLGELWRLLEVEEEGVDLVLLSPAAGLRWRGSAILGLGGGSGVVVVSRGWGCSRDETVVLIREKKIEKETKRKAKHHLNRTASLPVPKSPLWRRGEGG